jgi:antitoxin component YwqK of YwqJK toxin-antitoxin module
MGMTGQADKQNIRVPDDELNYDYLDNDSHLVFMYKGKRFTGVSYDDDPSNGLWEVSYVDGLQEGPERAWYLSGQLKRETMYRADMRHGHDREYHEDGMLASETLYEYGVPVRARTFAEDGSVVDSFDLSEESRDFELLQYRRAQYG